VGKAHEVTVLQDTAFVPKVQSLAGELSNWTQGSLLAQPADAYVASWKEGVWIYAENVHHSSRSQYVAPNVAQVQSEEHQVDH